MEGAGVDDEPPTPCVKPKTRCRTRSSSLVDWPAASRVPWTQTEAMRLRRCPYPPALPSSLLAYLVDLPGFLFRRDMDMATAAELEMYEPISGAVEGEETEKLWLWPWPWPWPWAAEVGPGAGARAGVNMAPPRGP